MTRRQPLWTLRSWAFAAYFVLFALISMVVLASNDPTMRVLDIEALLPGFYTHTSNLILSAALIMAYGLFRLIYGASIREIALFSFVVIAANYGYELFLTVFNTLDIVDAHYGAVASVVTFALMAGIKAFGLRPWRSKADGGDQRGTGLAARR